MKRTLASLALDRLVRDSRWTARNAADRAHDRAGLMALIEETWCMLNGMTTGSDDWSISTCPVMKESFSARA